MLHSLEIENFKSYRGKNTIGPFSKFTAIIGPNGSGKSNLMDAISFVLGERTTNLRVRKLTDLIHGAPIKQPVANRAHVTMYYREENGQMRSFSRSVVGSGSEYKINGDVVTTQQYTQELEGISIFIKAKNFLVYQGQIEAIAMKNPKERTALFEEISRSCEYQAEYDRLKAEMVKAEEDAQMNMNKRRGIAQEKREAKMEKDEAERYQNMKDDVVRKQTQLYLMEIFHCEKSATEAQEEMERRKEGVTAAQATKDEKDEDVAAKQKSLKTASNEYHALDKKATKKAKEVADKRPQFVQAKQQVLHIQSKLELAQKALNAAVKMNEKTESQLKELEQSKKDLEEQKAEMEAELAEQSQQQQLNLDEAQVAEYISLKQEAGKQSGRIDLELNTLKQGQEADRNAMQFEERRMKDIEEKIKNKEQEIERNRKQIEHLADSVEQLHSLQKDEKAALKNMEKDVIKSKEDIDVLTTKMSEVDKQLADAHGDMGENDRNKRRNEAIDNLKRVFPDKVFGRLVDLCTPSHKKFNLAVTKVLAKNMMSIVCDNEETAREGIMYLKEQRYPPETFLPSSALQVNPINENLRSITRPRNVKLVYDVINVQHPAARKALQFACGNALVCESPEDAKYMAYGETGDRHKAVSLDGTLFQQSGVISGGGADLRTKAKKWDETHIRKLKEEKTKLLEQLQEVSKKRKKELDVEMKRQHLQQLEYRERNVEKDRKRLEGEVATKLEMELETLNGELGCIPPKISELEGRMQQRQAKIDEMEKKSFAVADNIFAKFCKKLGIKDIREYENKEMRFHEEGQAKLREFDNELDRIRNEIEYFRSQNKEKKLKTEQEKVKNMEKEIKQLKKKEKAEEEALKALEEEQEALKMELLEKKTEMETAEADLAAAKKEAQLAAREVTNAEKAVLAAEGTWNRKRTERHNLLHAAKINQIQLPLSAGSLADVDAEDPDESAEDSQPTTSSVTQEQLAREQKIRLNYRTLDATFKEIEEDEEVKKHIDRVNKEIAKLQDEISQLNAPNLKANQRMEQVKEKEAETTEEFENARKKAKKIRQQFEKVKTERYRKFQDCFEPVAAKIDEIYKSLSRNASAQAFLGPDHMEEPYLEGIQYNCVAPGKRFRHMDNLSGGEKTVAALALLFAMHARNPSPFFVLDEIDAALDNTNIGKVAQFICDTARQEMQLIVISLKEEFYNKADSLVGIYPVPANCTVSGILTMDLSGFKTSGHDNANDANNDTVAT